MVKEVDPRGKVYVDYRIKPHTPLLVFTQPPTLLDFPLRWVLPGDIYYVNLKLES